MGAPEDTGDLGLFAGYVQDVPQLCEGNCTPLCAGCAHLRKVVRIRLRQSNSLVGNTTGSNNTAIGRNALTTQTGANDNVIQAKIYSRLFERHLDL